LWPQENKRLTTALFIDEKFLPNPLKNYQ
jgi:hypothetical protein